MVRLEYTLSEYVTDMAISLGIFTEGNVKCFEGTIPSANSIFGPWMIRSAIFLMCRFFPAVITLTWVFISRLQLCL